MFELISYEKFRDTKDVRFFDISVNESNYRDLVIHSGPQLVLQMMKNLRIGNFTYITIKKIIYWLSQGEEHFFLSILAGIILFIKLD